jgi:hypothetical protein
VPREGTRPAPTLAKLDFLREGAVSQTLNRMCPNAYLVILTDSSKETLANPRLAAPILQWQEARECS